MDALVVTLREGIEAALVIGIILSYLKKSGRSHLSKTVYAGIGAAVAASIGLAFLLHALGINPDNDLVEGILYLTAAVAVGSMTVWMWRTARGMRKEVEAKIDGLVAKREGARASVGLFVFTFFMIAREGVETVLFIGALSLQGTSQTMTMIGAIGGLLLAAAFGVLFVRGTLKVDLKTFFRATSFVLLLLAAKFLAAGVHGFAEAGRISLSMDVMRVIGFIVRDSTSTWLLVALLAIPMISTAKSALTKRVNAADDEVSDAERRKQLAAIRSERRWTFGAVGFTTAVVSLLAVAVATAQPLYQPSVQQVAARDGKVVIDAAGLKRSQLYKFSYVAKNGTTVRFIVINRGPSMALGLDACDVCGPRGYAQQQADLLICMNCNAPIPVASVGDSGGCNPITFASRTSGGRISIDVSALERAASVFASSPKRM